MIIGTQKKLLFFSILILLGIVFIGYSVNKSNRRLVDSEHWVQHSGEVILLTENILAQGREVKIASLNFIVTGDSIFLKSLKNAESKSDSFARQLQHLTGDNFYQLQRVNTMNSYIRKWLQFSFLRIQQKSKDRLGLVLSYITSVEGKQYTDEIQKVIIDIQREEALLLQQRKEANDLSMKALSLLSSVVFVLMIIFIILFLLVTRNLLNQHKEKEKRAAELVMFNQALIFENGEKVKRAEELSLANIELAFQNVEKENRAAELVIANEELIFQNSEKEKRAAELIIANSELVFQNNEKHDRATELITANLELTFQSEEKEKRASELSVANIELAFQNVEKENRAAELVIANQELIFQNAEKEKRAAELIIANHELVFQNKEKHDRAAELITANIELIFQSEEKEKRAEELNLANIELAFQNVEKESRAAELVIANHELVFQNNEKEKRAAELIIANKELVFQNKEKEKRAMELVTANIELAFQNKEKKERAAELLIANEELVYQNSEKEFRSAELVIANDELVFQNAEKEKRAVELIVANKELAFQNNEKIARAAELLIANQQLLFENREKEDRAAELLIANKELEFQNAEKEKRAIELSIKNIALKKAENATKQALTGLEKIMNASLDVICSMNAAGNFVEVSFAAERTWGYNHHELIGSKYLDIVFGEDAEKTVQVRDKIMSGIPVTMFENRVVQQNGKIVPMLWSARWDDKDQLIYCVAKDATEKKDLEKALENERQRFYDLFLQAPSCMGVLKGPLHIYEMVNPPYLKLIGRDEIIGKTVAEVLPEILDQGFISLLDEVYATGKSFTANEMLAKIDTDSSGNTVNMYLNIVYQAYRDTAGTIEGVFFFAVDVTEQVLLRTEIEVSEKRYRQIVETAKEGIWMIDNKNQTSFVNKNLCEMLGYTATEMIGKENTYFMDKEGREIIAAANKRNTSFDSKKVDVCFMSKTGKKVWAAMSESVILDSRGNYQSRLAMVTDITEQRIIAQRLSSITSSLNEAQVIARLGNWEIDLDQHTHYWSDEVYKIFGINKGEVVPSEEAFMSFFHPDDLDEAYEKIADGFKFLENIYFDFRFIRKDGEVRHGYNEWKFKFDQNNKPERLLGIFQDITERKIAEKQRIDLVSELTRKNKDLEQFAYIISHNLRAPVANILGSVEILNMPGISKANEEKVRDGLSQSVTKLDNVVSDLNHILQVKTEVTELRELVKFSELVDDISTSIKNLIDSNNISIVYDFSAINELLTLKSYLYSVFYNLISNSIKYRQPLVPCRIEIKSKVSSLCIQLMFIDNGMGIDLKKKNDQVFGLYKRFHPNTEGKGMGLYMVKTQVETLGGKISIQSEVNNGTEFIIEFKL